MKPKIEKIKLSKEQLQEIEMIKKGMSLPTTRTARNGMRNYTYQYTTKPRPISEKQQRDRLTKIFGGRCCICASLPDYKIIYNLDGARQIERYCEQDFEKYKDKIRNE